MFHEMKVYTGSGELKNIVSGKKLTKDFWRRFHENSDPFRNSKERYCNEYGTGPVSEDGEEDLYD